MTDLLDEDIITTDQGVSYHTLYTLRNQTLRYVSVEKEGWCPSVNNSPNNVVNMTPGGETAVSCTDSYLFFDDGGESGDYHAGQQDSNSSHLFVSQQIGHPLTIHFDSLNLSNTSHLLIFSGSEPRFDALIYELNGYSPNPNIIVSPTDTLMVYFIPGEESASGWSAIVQPSPGIAIGDIYKQNYILYRDTVCQSQTNTYFDRHNFTEGDANLQAELNAAVKISRVYLFERHFKDNNGCDSTVALSLLVTPPAYTQTDTVILSIDTPFIWNGMHCSATGQYAVYSQPYLDNCDSAEYLNLIVLEVDTSTNDVCIGDYTDMGVYVTTPDMKFFRPRPAVGDVLCTDGDILRPDSFLVSGKTPMGVVFYLDPSDPTHQRGKAVALFDAHDTYCTWAPQPATIYQNVHSITQRSTWQEAIADLDGYNNTLEIQRTALNVGGGSFQENAPAGYYCWYYDHMLRGSGPVHKYWYLPAAGEMMLLHSNRATVSKTLNMLAEAGLAAPFTDTYGYETMYWTSTEKNNNFSYYVNAKGQLMMHREKYSFWNSTYGYRFVRAIRNFPN